jgi:hypothetical protein
MRIAPAGKKYSVGRLADRSLGPGASTLDKGPIRTRN